MEEIKESLYDYNYYELIDYANDLISGTNITTSDLYNYNYYELVDLIIELLGV